MIHFLLEWSIFRVDIRSFSDTVKSSFSRGLSRIPEIIYCNRCLDGPIETCKNFVFYWMGWCFLVDLHLWLLSPHLKKDVAVVWPAVCMRLPRKWLSCLILVTHETSSTMRGASGATLQLHQILQRLPQNPEFKIWAKNPSIASSDRKSIRRWSDHDPSM